MIINSQFTMSILKVNKAQTQKKYFQGHMRQRAGFGKYTKNS